MHPSFISCAHGKEKASKYFAIWFWEIHSLWACLPPKSEEIPPLLVSTGLGWFCCPIILPLWSVPLFSINIPAALKSQWRLGFCCAKCFVDTCLTQLRKWGGKTVVQEFSVRDRSGVQAYILDYYSVYGKVLDVSVSIFTFHLPRRLRLRLDRLRLSSPAP